MIPAPDPGGSRSHPPYGSVCKLCISFLLGPDGVDFPSFPFRIAANVSPSFACYARKILLFPYAVFPVSSGCFASLFSNNKLKLNDYFFLEEKTRGGSGSTPLAGRNRPSVGLDPDLATPKSPRRDFQFPPSSSRRAMTCA